MKILVVGVLFTDIKGFPYDRYNPVGTNRGSVVMTHGGVSGNVAVDLANLGADVDFLTILDKTPFGADALKSLNEAGVCTKNAVVLPKDGMGIWLAVFDENGELAGSISKMPDVTHIEAELLKNGEKLIKDCDAVVAEYDTSEEIALICTRLAQKYNKPLYVIVGNMSIMLKRKDLLTHCNCVIMNEIEAGRLFDTSIPKASPERALEIMLSKGKMLKLKRMIMTLGEMGCVYADFASGEHGHVPSFKGEVVDTTGAGDAFFSEAVISLTNGMGLKAACERGTVLASRVIQSKLSVCTKADASLDGKG